MKILRFLGCLVIGHNKILDRQFIQDYTAYFTLCSQCGKKWIMKELTQEPKVAIKTYTIKMRAHAEGIIIADSPKIVIPKRIRKKQSVNIYLL